MKNTLLVPGVIAKLKLTGLPADRIAAELRVIVVNWGAVDWANETSALKRPTMVSAAAKIPRTQEAWILMDIKEGANPAHPH